MTFRRREIVMVHDITGAQVDAIGHGFLDLWTDDRLDQSEQMGFEIAADNPKAYRLAADVDIVHRSRRFYISEIEERRRGRVSTIAVEANAGWYRLGDGVFVGSFVVRDTTPRNGLVQILANTGWTVGTRTNVVGDSFSMEAQDKSKLAMLRTWSKITGLFLIFDTVAKTVDLVDERGAALGVAFRYGRNITGVRRRVSPPKLTRLFPYGADDLTIAGVNGGVEYLDDLTFYTDQGLTSEEAAALYTRARVHSEPSVLKEAELLALGQAKLAAEAGAQISYELDVVDLSEITEVTETARVGDTVGVHDPDFGDSVRPIVTRYRRHWLEPWRNRIELSTILDPLSDGSSSGRPTSSAEWVQFVGPVRSDYQVRNDGTFVVAAIPLRFREGGRADFHLDLWATGVGSGDMVVTVIDSVDGNEQQFKQVTVPYTDAETVRASISWAAENLVGSYRYAVRVTTVADGGAGSSKGVDVAADTGTDDVAGEYEASWWIKAQGAVQESPTLPNTVRFDYVSDALQSWTVPDNVEEITLTVAGAAGGGSGGSQGGGGSIVTVTIPVVPGTIYDVVAPEAGGLAASGGWPGGGDGGLVPGNDDGYSGGGYAALIPAGGAITDALLVAPGGGGGGGPSGNPPGSNVGGNGGFLVGEDGGTGNVANGGGATQSAGGTAGVGSNTGVAGSLGAGGRGANGASFQEGGGGGGGGYYGGGGGGTSGWGGGGGSGWIDPTVPAFDITIQDGANTGDGYLEMSWSVPIDQ